MEKKRKLNTEIIGNKDELENKQKKHKNKKDDNNSLLEIKSTNIKENGESLHKDTTLDKENSDLSENNELNGESTKRKKDKHNRRNDEVDELVQDENTYSNKHNSEKSKSKKKKRQKVDNEITDKHNERNGEVDELVKDENNDSNKHNLEKSKSKKRKREKVDNEITDTHNERNDEVDELFKDENNDSNNSNIEKPKLKKKKREKAVELNDSSVEPTNDTITPTTKKPPRNRGETKKQYKRRMRQLREAGILIDPIIDETMKKEKRNRKTRKEKRLAIEQKNEELDNYRCIIQINYLKQWKNDRTKWKFNKNVQGKLIKNMFNLKKIPQDTFEILVEYITESKAPKVHEDLNKKCTQVVEQMEKWATSSEEEKKKLSEPDSETYSRARQVLQSLT